MTTMTIGITCGNCKGKHETVAQVRGCYAGQSASTPDAFETATVKHVAKAAPAGKPASDRQVGFIKTLLAERNVPTEQVAIVQGLLAGGLTTTLASTWITALLDTPKAEQATPAPAAQATAKVPSGRYAIDHGDTVKFIKVDAPTEGRWAGYTFVKVQASDNEFPIKNRTTRDEMLAAVLAQGVKEAMLRYGREIGSCGHCGRTLTNQESRDKGIGPVCEGRMGW